MVKLLRLTTNNDGKFNADLDAGIQVSENAQIAVQNLTFETTFEVLPISGSNQIVEVDWKEGIANSNFGELNPITYTDANIGTLSQDLQGALNQTQVLDTTSTSPFVDNQNYGEFKCGEDVNTSNSDIQFKLCPLTGLFHMNEDGSRRTGDTELFASSTATKNDGSGIEASIQVSDVQGDGGINLGTVQQNTLSSAATDLLTNYIFPVDECGELSRGSGIFFCDVRNVTDNGGPAATNGFGIGLSFLDLKLLPNLPDQAIPDIDRSFEIRIERGTDTYSYRGFDSQGQSQITPFKFDITADTNPANHDLMMIEKLGNTIRGSICSTNSYLNLAAGNDWTQAPAVVTERFDTLDLGDVATYRRTQPGTALVHWWEAVDATNWNIYFTKPVIGNTRDTFATADLGTGVLTIAGGTTTFTPTGGVPPTVGGAAGLKKTIFEYELTFAQRNLPLYPYIYCCGNAVEAVAGHPVFTPHCLTEANLDYQKTGRTQILNSGTAPAGGFVNGFELYSLINSFYTSVLGANLNDPQFENDIYSKAQNMTIKVNNQVLRTLGFTVGRNNEEDFTFSNTSSPRTGIRLTNENVCGYDLIAQNENTIANSDNYVLMIDSNPIKSYDASKFNYDKSAPQTVKQSHRGRQLNILATIPINDNSNGVVEFQANELVYIDLDNKFPQALKNLRLRILDKNLNEIKTVGTAILTLLIKDE